MNYQNQHNNQLETLLATLAENNNFNFLKPTINLRAKLKDDALRNINSSCLKTELQYPLDNFIVVNDTTCSYIPEDTWDKLFHTILVSGNENELNRSNKDLLKNGLNAIQDLNDCKTTDVYILCIKNLIQEY